MDEEFKKWYKKLCSESLHPILLLPDTKRAFHRAWLAGCEHGYDLAMKKQKEL